MPGSAASASGRGLSSAAERPMMSAGRMESERDRRAGSRPTTAFLHGQRILRYLRLRHSRKWAIPSQAASSRCSTAKWEHHRFLAFTRKLMTCPPCVGVRRPRMRGSCSAPIDGLESQLRVKNGPRVQRPYVSFRQVRTWSVGQVVPILAKISPMPNRLPPPW